MDYTPPPANDLPEANPEYCAMLRRELDAVYDTGLAELQQANQQLHRDARDAEARRALSVAQRTADEAANMVARSGGTLEAQADAYRAAFQASRA